MILGDRYELMTPFAQGGMSEVWLARQQPLNRFVAVKLLKAPPGEHLTPAYHKRFIREAELAARLNHANIVQIIDYGEHKKSLYMVMEYVDGVTLAHTIQEKGGPLDPGLTVFVLRNVLDGIAAAHALGIVHRDLKSQNVMLVDDHDEQRVKILDFGLARKVQGPSVMRAEEPDPDSPTEFEEITETDQLVGSPLSMAPEQVQSQPVDARTDLYAVGVMLYEMLAGRPPYMGNTTTATMLMHLHEQPKPIPGAPPDLERIAMWCLEKEPDRRPQSARELLAVIPREVTEAARPWWKFW